MAKHRGKKYLEVAKLVEIGKLYDIREALELVQKTKTAKFTETVEVALRLGVDPRHADQQIRGTVVLPHGTGKSVKILAITSGENVEKALDILEKNNVFEEISGIIIGNYGCERTEKQRPFRDEILKRITRNIPAIENNMIGHVMDMDHIIIGREIDEEV